jgi:phosphohistidine phosphatase
MKLLLIRHGVAEVRDVFRATGKPDDLRPLTSDGRDKMARAALGLRRLVPALTLVASSPLTRAQETAKIVADAYGMRIGATTNTLNPDALLPEFAEWLATHEDGEVVAAVGHEPHLSTLVTWFLSGIEESRVVFKKGGAALLEFRGRPRKGGAVLHWLKGPKALRQLGVEK